MSQVSSNISVKNSKITTGRYGETIAARYLQKQGYRVLEQNFYNKRWGELDIVAIDNDQLIFVEVKTRIGDQLIDPEASIHFFKRKAIKRTAYFYIQSNQEKNLPESLRFDVVIVLFEDEGDIEGVVKHYVNVEI